MKESTWHLITTNDTIVRSTQALSVQQARFRLAPIEPGQLVVSALSYDVKESREIIASRRKICDLCSEPMIGENKGIYTRMHRNCYERLRRSGMNPQERQEYLRRRREYKKNSALSRRVSNSHTGE